MCLGLCSCTIEFLPFFAVVLLPVLGAFLGVDAILRVSILLCLHSVVVSLLPKSWLSALPFLQASLFILLAVFPLLWLPWPLVWLYGQLLWLLEPVLLVAEAVLAQNIIMRIGQGLAEKIENEEYSTVSKVVITLFSATCYAFAASGCWEMYKNNTSVQNGFLLVLSLLVLAVHNMFWMAREGVISDAAFCTVCMVAALGAMVVETQQIREPMQAPALWARSRSVARAVDLVTTLLNVQSGSRGVSFLMNVVLTPFFMLSLAFRLYSIIFIVSKVTQNFYQVEGETELTILDEDEILDPMAAWRSPLLLKLSVIFMLTQLTAIFLWEASGQYLATLEHWVPFGLKIWPQQILVGRIVQIGSLFGFYVWRLYCAEAWTWCEWLTP